MMQKTSDTDQTLKQLFQKLPKEAIPANLTTGIINHVCRAEKRRILRNTWLTWTAVSTMSILMVSGGILLFRYLSIDFGGIFKGSFPATFQDMTIPISMIGGIATLLLLFIDYRIRKRYLR